MHGGCALCKVSRYSAKFLLLSIRVLSTSRVDWVRALSCCHVRLSRPIGAEPSADTIEVNVEKLFILRHFFFKSELSE